MKSVHELIRNIVGEGIKIIIVFGDLMCNDNLNDVWSMLQDIV